MNITLEFREARPADGPELSRLAMRSKAHWGYSPEFMEACRDELTYHPQTIEDPDGHFVMAIDGSELIGFYALEDQCEDEIELGAMFVDPGHIGTGVGRQLMQRAIAHATGLGARRLKIVADPNALVFYQAAGAIHSGDCPSASIPGRNLPLLWLSLVED